jgi:hypothetical protein
MPIYRRLPDGKGAMVMESRPSFSAFLRRLLLMAVALLFLCTLGFGTASSARAETPAFVRIMHASPDIGVADIFLDGKVALSNFEFGTVTDYLAIPPGAHKVQVALIGQGPNAALITQTLAVQPGLAYTVAAIGDQTTGLSLVVFQEDNSIVTGKAKVRFYHLSPESGPVSVSVNGSSLIEKLSYLKASDYELLTPGQYTFGISLDGSKVSQSTTLQVQANTVTSIFTIGLVSGVPGLELVARQVNGTPGLPSTGSDPYASRTPASSSRPVNALVLTVALILAALALTGGISALALRPRPRSRP